MPADWELPMAKIVESEEELSEFDKIRSAYRKQFIEMSKRISVLENAINEVQMHLETNYDIDGNPMGESDAAQCLFNVMQNKHVEPERSDRF